MEKIESLQDFYKRKFDQVPGIVSGEIGHFNLFRLEPYIEGKPTNISYRRRDFYKIMLVKGNSEVHCRKHSKGTRSSACHRCSK